MRRGWLHLASGAGLGRLFGFASNLLLSRWLGPMELGLFNLLTTAVQTTDTVVRCGGDYAINFELGGQPESMQTHHGFQLARGLAQICSLMTALTCVVVFIWVWWGQGLLPIELGAIQRSILSCFLLLMIACEGISASAWEVLLVSHRTAPLALRQGLFVPLRLLFAAIGALFVGISGATAGWSIIALVQCFWLRSVLGKTWNPLQIFPLLTNSIRLLLRRGYPFYVSNLLSSIIFYPLLLKVAAGSGLAEIGYLRAGQILQQLFAFLPATLVPVLFLKLRTESTFAGQVVVMEKPLRMIWFVLLELLLLYCMFDQYLILWLFGVEFASALLPTRLLLITALFECLSQLLVQPLLAAGKTRLYGYWQNGAAILAAVLGLIWIPTAGLVAFLIVRFLYVILPLTGYGIPVLKQLHEFRKTVPLALATTGLSVAFLLQALTESTFLTTTPVFFIAFLLIIFFQRQDLLLFRQALSMRS